VVYYRQLQGYAFIFVLARKNPLMRLSLQPPPDSRSVAVARD